MFLTVSKRLEFSASRRLYSRRLSDSENLATYGEETAARYGTGRNYVAWFVFTGSVDPATGMLMNISEIKRRAGGVIDERYDHRFLNEDNADFADVVPTPDRVAEQLARDVGPLFDDSGATLTAVHLIESDERSATAYTSGVTESDYSFRFSAARRTMSPHLSDAENAALFGRAASAFGHGHEYRVRLSARRKAGAAADESPAQATALVDALTAELDHRNLNEEVPALRDQPMTTEALATYIRTRAEAAFSIDRVRLHERGDFFAESYADGEVRLGMQAAFSAAHRLQSYTFSDEQNRSMYGKCNNERGHGHLYIAEATIGGEYDARTGTLYNFDAFAKAMNDAVAPWRNRHLDLETEEFRGRPSTGENIVQTLWDRTNPLLQDRLQRLRLWETSNNRFTLRRAVP